jgi:hypothetical protein
MWLKVGGYIGKGKMSLRTGNQGITPAVQPSGVELHMKMHI